MTVHRVVPIPGVLPRLLTANDIATILGIHPSGVRRLDDLRHLWFRVPGKRDRVIHEHDFNTVIEKWREENRQW